MYTTYSINSQEFPLLNEDHQLHIGNEDHELHIGYMNLLFNNTTKVGFVFIYFVVSHHRRYCSYHPSNNFNIGSMNYLRTIAQYFFSQLQNAIYD